MKTVQLRGIALALMCLGSDGLFAAQTVFTNQADYIAVLESRGNVWIYETFEAEEVWGRARSTIVVGQFTQPAITNLGVRWTANHAENALTTSEGAALSGTWGLYSLPHGNFTTGTNCSVPGNCGDGMIGTSTQTMYGVAAWVRGTYGGKLALYLDGDLQNPVDFPEICDPSGENCVKYSILGGAHKFFGVIDTQGFRSFEFRELEGTAEDQKFIWADDFLIGFAVSPPSRIAAVRLVNDQAVVRVGQLAHGANYMIEGTDTLNPPTWTELARFVATTTEAERTLVIDPTAPALFLRLISP